MFFLQCFPLSVNIIVIYQLFKPKTWELSSAPPFHPPPHHNFIPATPISLLDSHIALFVSPLPPLVLPNQSPHVKFHMTSLTMQMDIFRPCPLLQTRQLLLEDPRMKSNVHNMVSEASRHLSISPNLPLAQFSALQFSFHFCQFCQPAVLPPLLGLDTYSFCVKAAFLPTPPCSDLIYFHSYFLFRLTY